MLLVKYKYIKIPGFPVRAKLCRSIGFIFTALCTVESVLQGRLCCKLEDILENSDSVKVVKTKSDVSHTVLLKVCVKPQQ